MAEQQIRFDDGAAYERMMGVWSRMAGEIFLDWLKPPSGARWIDIGCGNGAFTELIVDKTAPAEVQGIDPSDGQLDFARSRPAARVAKFQKGDAMALPFPDKSFDAATMALVIFFVPEPAQGVAEMARVVAPGGTVAAYAWDMEGGGFPLEPILAEIRALGLTHMSPPRNDAARMESMQSLWSGVWGRPRRRGDAGDQGAAQLRGFRGLLDHRHAGGDRERNGEHDAARPGCTAQEKRARATARGRRGAHHL
jgi:SAM-dependent methyltransferase